MKLKEFENSISYEENRFVFLNKPYLFKKFSQIELTTYLYPYELTVNSNDFKMLPYEEYIDDIASSKRSTYRRIQSFADQIFGLIIGTIIFLIFYIFNREELYSIESIVAVLGAYTVGKEIWGDLNNILINISRNLRISWRDQEFHYVKENFGTIQRFWSFARKQRYNSEVLLPFKFDFITHSNSKTVEMLFTINELENLEKKVLVLRIRNTNKKEINNSMFGIKLSLVSKILFVKLNYEIFQSNNKIEVGALDRSNNWIPNGVLIRNTISIGKIKIYRNFKIFNNIKILNKK